MNQDPTQLKPKKYFKMTIWHQTDFETEISTWTIWRILNWIPATDDSWFFFAGLLSLSLLDTRLEKSHLNKYIQYWVVPDIIFDQFSDFSCQAKDLAKNLIAPRSGNDSLLRVETLLLLLAAKSDANLLMKKARLLPMGWISRPKILKFDDNYDETVDWAGRSYWCWMCLRWSWYLRLCCIPIMWGILASIAHWREFVEVDWFHLKSNSAASFLLSHGI